MKIRPATLGDIPTINGIIIVAKRHWGYDDQLIGMWLSAMLVDEQVMTERQFWLAFNDNGAIGAVSVTSSNKALSQNRNNDESGGIEYQLEDCWVLPKSIGTGVGRRMFQHAANWAKQRGANSLRIDADPNAAGFYLKLGAQQLGTRPSTPQGRELPVFRYWL